MQPKKRQRGNIIIIAADIDCRQALFGTGVDAQL
jgi:hypothetical protein